LVNFAKWCGYELMAPEIDSTLKIRLINEKNQILKYKLLNVLAILPLLNNNTSRMVNETKVSLTEYAKIGLRTLILAKRNLGVEEYQQWKRRHDVK